MGFMDIELKNLTFAIAGMGLIGGSYAKALKKSGVKNIIGIDLNEATLAEAKACGVVDEIHTDVGEYLAKADILICCMYPEGIVDFLTKAGAFLKKGALVTDVAGIKGSLPQRCQSVLPDEVEFISGHPMAGRQSNGFAWSQAEIFDGANYIVVPTGKNTVEAVNWLKNFAKALGCKNVIETDVINHDRQIAFTSNLPHAVAVALMNCPTYNEKSKFFMGGGFRDGTRIADINPVLWSDLFLGNRENVLSELEDFKQQIELWQDALRNSDREALQSLMRKSSQRRKDLY